MPGNQIHFWERSTNWKTLNETLLIHKGQHLGLPSPHQMFYWFYLSQAWRVFLIVKIQVKAIWTRGRCGGAKLPSARQPHQNAYIIDTCKWFLQNPQSSLKNNDDLLSFCSITLNMLFLSHGYRPQHGQISGKTSLWKKCCLNPALSHFHMNRLRGTEEPQRRRTLVTLKH